MKICFIPIDNRPVCYNLPNDICNIDKSIQLYMPPREYLGGLTKYANNEAIINWFNTLPETDIMILCLDTLVYGGLIPSRRIEDSFEQVKNRLEKIKPFLKGKKIYAFSSIMRIPNNNDNTEEKEYWNKWGEKIFQYSFNTCKFGHPAENDIPKEILDDYLNTRKRNFEINKIYLEWQKEGLFELLIFAKDDCAEFGFNINEAHELEKLGGRTKTGADEIPLTLLASSIEKEIKIYPLFLEPKYINCLSNYEDISIEKSVLSQLELSKFKIVDNEDKADIVLVVNNFIEKQGELVMGWDTKPFEGKFKPPKKPFAVADVRNANGADNNFIEELFKNKIPEYGFAAWNTSANTLGSLMSVIKVKYQAKDYDDNAYKKLQMIRYLDDWAYQANVRGKIEGPCDISEMMKKFEDKIQNVLDFKTTDIKYSYPWNRKFEVEVNIIS